MKKIVITYLFYFIYFYSKAQGEANIWYFGTNAGIDFSNNEPVVLTNGKLSTTEGCATMSDANGNLLFYTNGVDIWNKEHTLMTNGTGLLGHLSSTQSAVIVQKPKDKNLYYIFTVDVADSNNGLSYSIVDISLEEGKGKVIEKNVQLIAPTAEKVTAIRHKDNNSVWVITHKWGNDEYFAYLLTEKGVQNSPVISAIGEIQGMESDNSIGYMKASSDGKKLAVAIKGKSLFELFNFDNLTGKITNPIALKAEEGELAYGVEFSSDNTKLYGTTGSSFNIYQFDLKAENINKTREVIGKTQSWAGALQMAPNGKIYISEYAYSYLGCIEHPNKKGLASTFIRNAIDLKGKKCQLGLPTFVQTYFDDLENLQKINAESGKKIKIGEVFVKTILFDFNQFVIKPEYYATLDELVEYLKSSENTKIDIAGHTDSDGTDQGNLLLSQNRSKAVAAYIITKGINKSRINFKGYGKTKPILPNTTLENKAKNRRIEFILIKS
ncbi:MAG: OmpA family protein [Cytophagales bacterium]|nr:MAG: OmpA family protein [Cytophagales bacterium]